MKKHYINVRWSLLVVVGMMVVAALAGCAADTTAPELQPRPTDENAPTPVAALAQNDEGGMAMTGEGTPEVEFTDFACLDCHTDEEQLKALAVEEKKENLSEGPG